MADIPATLAAIAEQHVQQLVRQSRIPQHLRRVPLHATTEPGIEVDPGRDVEDVQRPPSKEVGGIGWARVGPGTCRDVLIIGPAPPGEADVPVTRQFHGSQEKT